MRIHLVLLLSCVALGLPGCGGDERSGQPVEDSGGRVKTLEPAKDPDRTGTGNAAPTDVGTGATGGGESAVSKEELKRQAMVKRLGESLKAATDSDSRAEALANLAEMGEDAKGLRDAVVATLDDEDALTRCLALQALARIDPRGSRMHLEKALKDDDGQVRAKAAALWTGTGATDFRPLLTVIEDDIDQRAQLAAMLAVEEKGSHFLAPQIAGALSGLDGPAARSALRFLVKNKEHVGGAVGRVADLLTRSDPVLRKEAAEALETIGTKNKAVVSALIDALSDEEEAVMLAANKTLVSLTGKDLGLNASQTPAERELRVNSWKQWYKANEASLGG